MEFALLENNAHEDNNVDFALFCAPSHNNGHELMILPALIMLT